MSKIYDNWERLVAAVLKREQIWKLCHSDSIESSISSMSPGFSPSSSSRFNDTLNFTGLEEQIEQEWIKRYEPGVYITLASRKDGSTEIKRAHFSKRRFSEKDRYIWWLNNRENVFKKYNDTIRLERLRQITVSNWAGSLLKAPLHNNSDESEVPKASNELASHVITQHPHSSSRTTLDKNMTMRSKSSEDQGISDQIIDEWKEQYEPGVYVTIAALIDGSREVKRLRFSWRKFTEQEAKAWWLENREIVLDKYNRKTGCS